MEESIIFALLDQKHINNYREELNKEENNFTRWIKESREELEKSLDCQQLILVDKYKHHICLNEEYINYQVGIKILNYGIKIGMEINKAINDIENIE